MSWLDEAQQKIREKQTEEHPAADGFPIENQEFKEQLTRRLRLMYDNATEREIEKAIENAVDRLEPPYEEKSFMAFLRTKLED